MSDNSVFSHDVLSSADLVIDARYAGTRNGNASDEPLTHLLKLSNQGGFRIRGKREDPLLLTILSSLEDPDWPDDVDLSTGVLTYYGDNKKPGRKLDETKRYGNNLLERIFESLHLGKRQHIPPVLVFTKAGVYRDKIFRGLAVPGAIGSTQNDDLVSVWHTSNKQRFLNYKATFTILNVPRVPRAWLDDIINHGIRGIDSKHAPKEWLRWVTSGQYTPLISKRSRPVRSKEEQLPDSERGVKMLAVMNEHFKNAPFLFEACAAHIVRLCLPNTVELDLTKPYRDGGRDGIGKLRIGRQEASVLVDFAIEAKCYNPKNSVGVREMARLISRLRHRQFGVLITTSWVNTQAYKEVVEDGHPVMILSGRDIIELLEEAGLHSDSAVAEWLQSSFPTDTV
ncbi:restriction endonuclease [Pseudomonas prosekii]|uniref:restriction endonuclease n=1 Tax=Pseudomonas prosekii TaxID=1148509 RepID=UPI0028E04528|nr:restriction endonuclease [Pseudomonas prosekii]MDT8908847.1 restriction endonuclease [Pseudomonas prosekii]